MPDIEVARGRIHRSHWENRPPGLPRDAQQHRFRGL